ncbi:MAG TPA: AraC family transcriptional regulator [Firmicutes bacterium]|nr:AraC family transcriptional regulator [Bacillota bacterium]
MPAPTLRRPETSRPDRESTCRQGPRKVLTAGDLRLPGLLLFGRNRVAKAAEPLVWHVHPGCLEFVILLKGEESYFADGQRYDLTGGDVFVSFRGQPHRSARPYQSVNELLWFLVDPAAEHFLGLCPQSAAPVREALLGLREHAWRADGQTLRLAQDCFDAFLQPRDPLFCTGLFLSLLSGLLSPGRRAPSSPGIRRAERYIRENLAAELPLETLSRVAGLSLSGFKRRFRLETGRTPREYINGEKIRRAKELLGAGRSVTDTAMALGFASSDYFSVVFKRYTRLTPSGYRHAAAGEVSGELDGGAVLPQPGRPCSPDKPEGTVPP